MTAGRMHADEVDTDVSLVRRLLVAQFAEWADLTVAPVNSAGTDNAIYRLGNDMAVRMPRVLSATGQVDKEQRWLPGLAPHLPLAIPVPLAMGEPGEGYPWRWSICRWLEGGEATIDRIADPRQLATDLASFVTALQRIDTAGGPAAGAHNFWRGVPLARRDGPTRDAIARCAGLVDATAVTAAWETDLNAAPWPGPPVWIHGDLQSGNLLAVNGRLGAVIDFGGLGVGDPACDLMVAWNLLPAESREVFRTALAVDDATWSRGRGWALSVALVYVPYYRDSNPEGTARALQTIDEILRDHERGT